MLRVSDAFGLGKTQRQLDFVDVELNRDTPLFLDPLALSQRVDRWSVDAHGTLVAYFQELVDKIRSGQLDQGKALLSNLSEPNETRLGFSARRPQGAGIGDMQADQIFAKLAASTAVRTGFLTSLQDCELMIDGISRDKISDLTTNVIRKHLAKYTQAQCELHGIPMQMISAPAYFDPQVMSWRSDYLMMPVYKKTPLLLVPKAITRRSPLLDSGRYYDKFVVNYLQGQALNASSSLVRALKNGTRVVYKQDVRAAYPFSKAFLLDFSQKHPSVLANYRDHIMNLERKDRISDADEESDPAGIASALAQALPTIATGPNAASEYHKFMIGALELLLFPHLGFPLKEREIHDGRKRIDIVMQNCAREGVFFELPTVRQMSCSYILIECKNYSTDVANPELDQLAGRMGINRGMVGIMCCRNFEDRSLFVQRCRDTFADRRQLIIAFDDCMILEMLKMVTSGESSGIDEQIRALIAEVWL